MKHIKLKKYLKQFILAAIITAVLLLLMQIFFTNNVKAASLSDLIDLGDNPDEVADSLQILLLLTILALAPSILIMMTSFTRIIIVLSFTRNAMGTNQMPPNQVLIGLALFLTFFIMSPVISEINTVAYQPLKAGTITQEEALKAAEKPIREFMLKNMNDGKDLNLFLELSGQEAPESFDEVPMTTLIPAFITSELKTAFQMAFFIFIPFIVIDMIVASTLMSMGMMMLPPILISLPFKILLFILVDGWGLTIKTLVESFA